MLGVSGTESPGIVGGSPLTDFPTALLSMRLADSTLIEYRSWFVVLSDLAMIVPR